ncbi:MAG: hypothetical protein K6C07_08220 [Bacteroidales bacterium]|jgi:hypothetical protein|nr:hypothetical protein [Bacteroidales bacterium]MCR5191372.1 hypothetical protein [Bacteroidales bacterium]
MRDTLAGVTGHLSFADTHHLSNGEIFLIGFLGVFGFMLILLICMKLIPLLARRIDKNKNEKE